MQTKKITLHFPVNSGKSPSMHVHVWQTCVHNIQIHKEGLVDRSTEREREKKMSWITHTCFATYRWVFNGMHASLHELQLKWNNGSHYASASLFTTGTTFSTG